MPRQGELYRNSSGVMLYGFIPPHGLVELRNIGSDDRAFPGSAFQGDVVIEWDPGDNTGILRSIAIPMDELTTNFSAVED